MYPLGYKTVSFTLKYTLSGIKYIWLSQIVISKLHLRNKHDIDSRLMRLVFTAVTHLQKSSLLYKKQDISLPLFVWYVIPKPESYLWSDSSWSGDRFRRYGTCYPVHLSTDYLYFCICNTYLLQP